MDKYEEKLDRANIHSDFEVVAGDCISIANAICEVFGGRVLAVSSRPSVRTIEHAVVEIDDSLYDGRGRVSKERVIKEFSSSDPTPENKNCLIWEPVDAELNRFKGDLYESVVNRLRD